MQPVLNVEDVKQVESDLTGVGVSISELMHRAGVSTAREVMGMGNVEKVVVMCGLGNNGGDGWVCSESLKSRGIRVSVVTPVEPDAIRGDLARVVANSAKHAGVSVLVAPPRDQLERVLVLKSMFLMKKGMKEFYLMMNW